MPAAQRRTVTALTLPLLGHYGYRVALGPGGNGSRARRVGRAPQARP